LAAARLNGGSANTLGCQSARRRLLALGLGAPAFYGFSSAASAAYLGVPTPTEVPGAVEGTLIAVGFGFVLYIIRCWWLELYGCLEILAAVFLIYFSIAPAKLSAAEVCDGRAFWGLGCFLQSHLLTLAAIYVLVRGLDNVQAKRLLCRMQAWRQKRHRDGHDGSWCC
jgi:hypothetical protein